MTAEQIKKEVWEIIDEHCMDISKEEYIELMEDLANDMKMRAEASREELIDETGDTEE